MITYLAINTKNGKFYIGSTSNFLDRKRTHLSSNLNHPFQNALRKDSSSFVWEVYEDNSEDPVLEQALLDQWYGKEQCYNLSPFAGRPPTCTGHTEETINKMKQTRNLAGYGDRVRKWIQEKFEDPEFKESHRRATIEGSNTPEARLKNSQRRIENWNDPDYRERLKEAHRNKWKDPEYRNKQSEARKNLRWFVNPQNQTTKANEAPGPEWKPGRKWKP